MIIIRRSEFLVLIVGIAVGFFVLAFSLGYLRETKAEVAALRADLAAAKASQAEYTLEDIARIDLRELRAQNAEGKFVRMLCVEIHEGGANGPFISVRDARTMDNRIFLKDMGVR